MSISGTSMASPNIAGLAAQLLQIYPTATPAQIRQKIIDTSTVGVLYDAAPPSDYSNSQILHGGPNRVGYQALNTANSGGITGQVRMTNTGLV